MTIPANCVLLSRVLKYSGSKIYDNNLIVALCLSNIYIKKYERNNAKKQKTNVIHNFRSFNSKVKFKFMYIIGWKKAATVDCFVTKC